MIQALLTSPLLAHVPLAFQLNLLQVVAVVLAALTVSNAYAHMARTRPSTLLSAEVMLGLALMSVVLASTLASSDQQQPDHAAALVVRLVLGGALVSVWHTARTRIPALARRAA